MVLIAESEQVWVAGRQVDDEAHQDGSEAVNWDNAERAVSADGG